MLVYNNVVTDKRYFILHIYGKSAPFDYSKSEVVNNDYSFIEIKGRYFDVNSVNGYDIFIVEKTVMTFVTERLKELMTNEGFSNVEFISNTEYTAPIPVSLYNAK